MSSSSDIAKESSGVGAELKAAQVLLAVPVDSLWASALPSNVSGGVAVSPSQNFCYYYFIIYADGFGVLEASQGQYKK